MAVKSRQASPRLDQGLLGKIFGPVGILTKSERAAPQASGVLFSQPLEGNRLASLGSVDQLSFIVFGPVHCIGDSPVAAKRFTRENIFLGFPIYISRNYSGLPPGQ